MCTIFRTVVSMATVDWGVAHALGTLGPRHARTVLDGGVVLIAQLPGFVSISASPRGSASAMAWDVLERLDGYGVVVLRGAKLDTEGLLEFGGTFGELVQSWDPFAGRAGDEPRLQVVEVADAPSREAPGDSTSRRWHTDVSFVSDPSPFTVLVCQTPAELGGATEFADLRSALGTLPTDLAETARRATAIHSFGWRIGASLRAKQDPAAVDRLCAAYPDVSHPLVVRDRGFDSLFLSELCLRELVGIPEAESDCFVRLLNDHATDVGNVFAHEWMTGDVVVWNNRAVMHRRSLGAVVGTRRLLRMSTRGMSLQRAGEN